MTPVSVVILTFNSAATIGATLDSLAGLTDDVHVVDSGSTDGTKEIVAAKGARLVEHPFENYGAQRNWAIDSLPLAYPWQLHLDADERLTPELKAEIATLLAAPVDETVGGFYVPRLVPFPRHGAASRRHVPDLPHAPLPFRPRPLRGAQIRPALPRPRVARKSSRIR